MGQQFEDTKRGNQRPLKSQKDRQHMGQKFEDTKGVIRDRQSQKNRQHKAKKGPKDKQ